MVQGVKHSESSRLSATTATLSGSEESLISTSLSLFFALSGLSSLATTGVSAVLGASVATAFGVAAGTAALESVWWNFEAMAAHEDSRLPEIWFRVAAGRNWKPTKPSRARASTITTAHTLPERDRKSVV